MLICIWTHRDICWTSCSFPNANPSISSSYGFRSCIELAWLSLSWSESQAILKEMTFIELDKNNLTFYFSAPSYLSSSSSSSSSFATVNAQDKKDQRQKMRQRLAELRDVLIDVDRIDIQAGHHLREKGREKVHEWEWKQHHGGQGDARDSTK